MFPKGTKPLEGHVTGLLSKGGEERSRILYCYNANSSNSKNFNISQILAATIRFLHNTSKKILFGGLIF